MCPANGKDKELLHNTIASPGPGDIRTARQTYPEIGIFGSHSDRRHQQRKPPRRAQYEGRHKPNGEDGGGAGAELHRRRPLRAAHLAEEGVDDERPHDRGAEEAAVDEVGCSKAMQNEQRGENVRIWEHQDINVNKSWNIHNKP